MKKLLASFAVLSLLVSCGGNKPGPEPTEEQVCPEGAVDMGIVLPRLDKDGNPMKDADGNEITYKVFWAKSNLSEMGLCANEADYGDYYAWGAVQPYYAYGHSQDNPCTAWRNGKTSYDWDAYPWADGSYKKITKYCTNSEYWGGLGEMDGKTEFSDYNYADDPVRYVLHGKWRTPTDAEWVALRDGCQWQWKTKEDGYSHLGVLVTAGNGNSIFLPAASWWTSNHFNNVYDVFGYYWASTVHSTDPTASFCLTFDDRAIPCRSLIARHRGLSVRPVSE